MALYDVGGYWTRDCGDHYDSEGGRADKRKPLFPLAEQLALEKGCEAALRVMTTPDEVVACIAEAAEPVRVRRADVHLGNECGAIV